MSLYELLRKPLLASQSPNLDLPSPSSPRPSSSSSGGSAAISSNYSSPSSPVRPSRSSPPATLLGGLIISPNDEVNYKVDRQGNTFISKWKVNVEQDEDQLARSGERFLNRSRDSVTNRERLMEEIGFNKGLIYLEECRARGFDPGHTEYTILQRWDAVLSWIKLNRSRSTMSMSNYDDCVLNIQMHNANVRRLNPQFYNEILAIPN